jgi:hypothetical protein
MNRNQIFDIMNFLASLTIFVLSLCFAYIGLPLWVQVSPVVLLVIPLGIALHKKRVERERIKTQKNIILADKIRILSVKLARIADVPDIGSGLTYNKQFLTDEIAWLGWRRYFDRYGRKLSSEFGSVVGDLYYFLEEGYKFEKKEDFYRRLISFREIVSSFCHLHDDLADMIRLGGKIPKERIGHIREYEANYEDFLKALRDSCDGDEEIERVFGGRYPLVKNQKKSI